MYEPRRTLLITCSRRASSNLKSKTWRSDEQISELNCSSFRQCVVVVNCYLSAFWWCFYERVSWKINSERKTNWALFVPALAERAPRARTVGGVKRGVSSWDARIKMKYCCNTKSLQWDDFMLSPVIYLQTSPDWFDSNRAQIFVERSDSCVTDTTLHDAHAFIPPSGVTLGLWSFT